MGSVGGRRLRLWKSNTPSAFWLSDSMDRCRAFDVKQAGDRARPQRLFAQPFQIGEYRIGAWFITVIATQQRAAVADLGIHPATRELQTYAFIERSSVLRSSQFDVAVSGTDRVSHEPATV